MELNFCGATLISSQYAVTALHCIPILTNAFEKLKKVLPSGTKPADILVVVAGAYFSRNYTLNSDSKPEYKSQVSKLEVYVTNHDSIHYTN